MSQLSPAILGFHDWSPLHAAPPLYTFFMHLHIRVHKALTVFPSLGQLSDFIIRDEAGAAKMFHQDAWHQLQFN